MPQKSVTHDEALSLYNTRIKIFPHQIKVTCFSRAIFNPDGVERTAKPKRVNREEDQTEQKAWNDYLEKTDYEQYQKAVEEQERHSNLTQEKKRIRRDSVKRSMDKALEIAYANEWKYFITFTLDQKQIDRYDKTEILRSFTDWLKNMTRRHDLMYFIFPEYHEDGAVHFHGLCAGKLDLVFSGRYTDRGQRIYNCLNWSLGFTSVVILEGPKERIVNYIMKYVTKDNRRVFGNAYFAGGKGLIREVPTQYDNLSFDDLEGKEYLVPDTGMKVKYQTIQRGNENDEPENTDYGSQSPDADHAINMVAG